MSNHRLIKTHRLIIQNKSKQPLQQTRGETVLPFIFFKYGVQHEMVFDSGGNAKYMGVGFRGTMSYT